jgi:hypothetical protein
VQLRVELDEIDEAITEAVGMDDELGADFDDESGWSFLEGEGARSASRDTRWQRSDSDARLGHARSCSPPLATKPSHHAAPRSRDRARSGIMRSWPVCRIRVSDAGRSRPLEGDTTRGQNGGCSDPSNA